MGSRPLGLWIVDIVATLLLVGKRLGMTIELRDVSPELAALLELVGLDDAEVGGADLTVELTGQVEHREQIGVEEVVMADDLVADDLDHLDRPGLVAALAVRLVRAERRAAVRRRGDEARPSAPAPLADEPPAHLDGPPTRSRTAAST